MAEDLKYKPIKSTINLNDYLLEEILSALQHTKTFNKPELVKLKKAIYHACKMKFTFIDNAIIEEQRMADKWALSTDKIGQKQAYTHCCRINLLNEIRKELDDID